MSIGVNFHYFEVKARSKKIIAPIVERTVLEDVRDGKLRKGLLTYKGLANAFRQSSVAVRLDFRYLQIAKMINAKDKKT